MFLAYQVTTVAKAFVVFQLTNKNVSLFMDRPLEIGYLGPKHSREIVATVGILHAFN